MKCKDLRLHMVQWDNLIKAFEAMKVFQNNMVQLDNLIGACEAMK